MPTIAVKYRLYPTSAQESTLHQALSLCCAVYNSLVNWRRHDYERFGKSPAYLEQKKALPAWKQAHEELTTVHSQVLQDVCKRVDLAYAAFFRRLKDYQERKAKGRLRQGEKPPGRPRFKGEGHYDSLTYPQEGGFRVGSDTITLSKIGQVKAVIHRPLPGTAKNCTMRIQAGKWFACISCEVEAQPLPECNESVGIDVGLEHFAAKSDGEFVENPGSFAETRKPWRKRSAKSNA